MEEESRSEGEGAARERLRGAGMKSSLGVATPPVDLNLRPKDSTTTRLSLGKRTAVDHVIFSVLSHHVAVRVIWVHLVRNRCAVVIQPG